MNIEEYFGIKDGALSFSRESASNFAKKVAGDFNPIHDPESRRFCVPGDLLFAVFLHRHGLSTAMTFKFLNMVTESVLLHEQSVDDDVVLQDAAGREYLGVKVTGAGKNHAPAIAALTSAYVQFSGQTFPYLLVDLMKEHDVMINPARPLVIYNSMELNLTQLEAERVELKFSGATLAAEGKKAQVGLHFDIFDGEVPIGDGAKNMLLGGLRPFDQSVMDELVSEYNTIKNSYQAV